MPSTAENREAPLIPNHEMVRSIGRGSYGEIWLARSLTGTWRAVKIVDRRTFESDKAFQREFEGMAAFEPISREDSGFVDILHVGRDENGGFFYYVMELADDHLGGEDVDPANYVPKTIKAELGRRNRLLADECIIIGLSLTSALEALHRCGLVHRDIKPANIIFVGGMPKIADIGLVAESGQNSYVGTEGYVPPEGPGSPQADIYSLGKVLYEMAMGKDRMDFPAINTHIADLPDKVQLLKLNEILLRACCNDCETRYASAQEMHDDLLRLRDGKALGGRAGRRGTMIAGLAAVVALGGAGFYNFQRQHARGGIEIATEPPGAMVVLDGSMRRSPASFDTLPPGPYTARVMLAGYEPEETRVEIQPNLQVHPAALHLRRSHGSAKIDSQPSGANFELSLDGKVIKKGTTPATVSDLPTGDYQLTVKLDQRSRTEPIEIKRAEVTEQNIAFPSGHIAVTSEPPGAEVQLDGQPMGVTPLMLDSPEGDHELLAKYQSWPEQRRAIHTDPAKPIETAFVFSGGTVKIASAPGGASVWKGNEELGLTPLLLEDLPPGTVKYELRLVGFKTIEVGGKVNPGEQTFLDAHFVKRPGPRPDEPYENSLGMKFVPVGNLLVGVWPVRVQDYDAFCAATKRARSVPDFAQDENHPVVKVNWEDATAFCEWLTNKEHAAGQLEAGQVYRLPTDQEWSVADNLLDEGRNTPEERDGKASDFPWDKAGKQWPPPAGFGNFADGTGRRGAASIPGYHDGFAQTSPVGSFPPNRWGLYDMSGNVWQWCRDPYKGGGSRDWGVLRGGSWGTAKASELRSAYRNVIDRSERDVIYGFRCVLVPESGN